MSEDGRALLFGVAMVAAGVYILGWCLFMAYWRKPGA